MQNILPFLFILVVIHIIETSSYCSSEMFPKSTDQCILTSDDKKYFGYKYCCFEKDEYLKSCNGYSDFSKIKNGVCYNATNMPEGCEYIKPEKASDCQLSENEKSNMIIVAMLW